MASPIPRVFTIPASVPFLPTLIEALLGGRLVPGFPAGPDPLALAGATLYLPTRRACRLARDTFLEVTGESAAILTPAFFAGVAPGPSSMSPLFDRAAEAGRLCGLRLEGVWMHVGTPDAVNAAEAALLASVA